MRRMRAKVVAATVAAAAVVTVSACGGDSEEAAEAPSSAAGSSAEPGSADGNPAGERSDGSTPPGTELKLGEKAVIPYEAEQGDGMVAITVTAIERGDQAAFDKKFGDDDSAGIVPYYVRYTARNVGDVQLGHRDKIRLKGRTADGKVSNIVLIGDLDECVERSFPRTGGNTGTSIESCVLVGSRSGEITAVTYNRGSAGYSSDPINWRA
ncbi:hypothetical protein SAMN05216266_11084 [Amycolatopsis marina]|uniref:DUF4352 domain-containing protein n=1 Tax=Amycolatopsis marina TaxID=490629 RepID=A0A1I1AR57_9PSEU|nr:hypothetical protein [Amycolatopsis marina]SFB40521.1 hypothetical protein SAMN05216266_11084 [Amycolatopsis marina]